MKPPPDPDPLTRLAAAQQQKRKRKLFGFQPNQGLPYGAKPDSVGVYKEGGGVYYAEPNIKTDPRRRKRYAGGSTRA